MFPEIGIRHHDRQYVFHVSSYYRIQRKLGDMESDDDIPIFSQIFRERHDQKKRHHDEDVAALQRRNRPRRYKPSKIEDELQRAICGQRKIELINPVLEEDMDRKISRAVDITRLYPHVSTLELQVVFTVFLVHLETNISKIVHYFL